MTDIDTDGYFYCYVYGNRAPIKRHDTRQAAEQEAKRITEKDGHKVEILQCVAVSLPVAHIVELHETKSILPIDKIG